MTQPPDDPRHRDPYATPALPPAYPHRGGPPTSPWPDPVEPAGPDPAFPSPPPPTTTQPSAGPATSAARRGRGKLIAGLAVLAILVLGVGGAGAWLLLRDPDRDGAADPVVAVREFVQAVYGDQDPAAAAERVCSESRDEAAISAKIDEVRANEQTYVTPRYAWNRPEVVEQSGELAVVGVTVTMTTGDERISQQDLRVTVLNKEPNGWWVCDVATGAGPSAGPTPSGTAPAEGASAEPSGTGTPQPEASSQPEE